MQKRVYFYAVSAVVIWSSLAAMTKHLLTALPTFQTLFLSSLIASVFLLVMHIARGGGRDFLSTHAGSHMTMAGLGFLGLFLYSSLYYYGLTQLTSQEAVILNYLWPMMIVLFSALLLKERLTARTICAFLLSFSGIALLTLGGEEKASGDALLGVASCVLAAICYGLFCVLNKKCNMNQVVTMTVAWGATALSSLPVTLAFETWVPLSWEQWLGMLWLGVFVDAVAYLWWALALQTATNSAAIANFAYAVPLLSLVVSAVTLGERMGLSALLAFVLIMGGILLQSLRR